MQYLSDRIVGRYNWNVPTPCNWCEEPSLYTYYYADDNSLYIRAVDLCESCLVKLDVMLCLAE